MCSSDIARYLRSLAVGKSETKNFGDRLKFDQRTWAPKYQQMIALLQTVTDNLDNIGNDAATVLQLPPNVWNLSSYVSVQAVIKGLQNISNGMRTVVESSMASLDVISRDVLYTSSLIGSYHLLYDDASERQMIYDTYMRPLRQRIQQFQPDLDAVKQRLFQEYSNDQGTWTAQLVNQWHLASGSVNNLPPQGNAAMNTIQEATGNLHRIIACYTSIIDKFDECQGMLHPGFVQSWDRTLDHSHAVQMARTMRHEYEERKEAAAQEMGRITSPSLLALIHGFIACIQAYLHDTPQKGSSLETLGLRREAAVEAYVEVLARQQISELTEASPGNRTENELEDMLQARIVQIRNEIASDPDMGGDANDSSSSNNGSSDGDGASGGGGGDGGDVAMQGVVANLGAVPLG